jgi:tripartite-type tricarboxylate transporter receptor subunit TctC
MWRRRPTCWSSPPNLPVKTVAELVAYMKANPDKLSFGSPGIGTSVHVCGELFKSLTGTTMAHVPYKGPPVRDPRPGGRADPGLFALPEVRARLDSLGLETWISSPDELARFQAAEIIKWAKVVKDSGAKAD